MRSRRLSLLCLLPLSGCLHAEPGGLGLVDGRLTPCPDSPNCVSSQADPADEVHYLAPWSFSGEGEAALGSLADIIAGTERTCIVVREGSYLRAEYTSALWRFVDDVEILVDEQASLVHFRSASRVGYSDMGANRERLEALGAAFRERTGG